MAEGSKVGEGYIELGLDKNPLVDALRSSEKTFQSSMETMGKQAKDFASSFGQAMGVAMPVGLGAGFFKLIKDMVDETPQLAAYYIAMKEMGIGTDEAKQRLISMSTEMRKFGAVSRGEMAGILTQFARIGIVGEQELVAVLEETAGLARRAGVEFGSAARDYANLIRTGTALPEQYGVILGPAAMPRERITKGREFARATVPMAEEMAKLPQERIKRTWSAIWDAFKQMVDRGAEIVTDPRAWYEQGQRRWRFQPISTLQQSSSSAGGVMENIAIEGERLTQFNTGLTAEQRSQRGGVGRIGGVETGLTESDLTRAMLDMTDTLRETNARLLNAEQRAITGVQPTEGPF